MYGRTNERRAEPREKIHYSHNIILELHAIQITNNFQQRLGNRNRATRKRSHRRWSQWVYLSTLGDLNETFAYVSFFRISPICNAGNKGGRRSPRSMRKSLTYEISESRTSQSETGTSDNCVGRIEGNFTDFLEMIGRTCLPSWSHRDLCGLCYVFLFNTNVVIVYTE